MQFDSAVPHAVMRNGTPAPVARGQARLRRAGGT